MLILESKMYNITMALLWSQLDSSVLVSQKVTKYPDFS